MMSNICRNTTSVVASSSCASISMVVGDDAGIYKYEYAVAFGMRQGAEPCSLLHRSGVLVFSPMPNGLVKVPYILKQYLKEMVFMSRNLTTPSVSESRNRLPKQLYQLLMASEGVWHCRNT